MDHNASTAFGGSFTGAPRETERLFRKIFEHCSEAVLVVDPAAGRILDTNPRACALLGYSRDELLAVPLSTIHPASADALRADSNASAEWLGKSGTPLPVELSIASTEVDGRDCLIATVRPRAAGGDLDPAQPLRQLAQHLTLRDLRTLEREIIERALDATGGKIYGEDGAAAALGLPPTTLASRLKRLGIEKSRTNGSSLEEATA